MRSLNRSQSETLRMIIGSGDDGLSFTELKRSFPGKISERGLTDALRALEKAGLIQRDRWLRSKGARAKYRITHPGPVELVISDVVRFLQQEPTTQHYTGVFWMGLLVSSGKELGLVLNEDQEYNHAYLKVFLTVHDKWVKHVLKSYEDNGRQRELKIIAKCEEAVLDCCKAYNLGIESPFTKAVMAIDNIAKVRLNVIEMSDTLGTIPGQPERRLSYVDLLCKTMERKDQEGSSPTDAKSKAEPCRKFLERRSNKRVYEAFLSRCTVPQSVLFMPFGFRSALPRFIDLMTRFAEAGGVDPMSAILTGADRL